MWFADVIMGFPPLFLTKSNTSLSQVATYTPALKTLDNSENIDLIYYWNYSEDVIECYGSMLNNNSKNNHVLPCGGISNSFEENSEDMTLYGNIYILDHCWDLCRIM